MQKLSENNLVEQPTIDWFKQLGYEYKFGPDISPGGVLVERNFEDVILENRLKSALRRLNPNLSEKGIDEVVYKLKHIEHPNLEIANKEAWETLTQGVKIKIRDKNGETKGEIVKIVDFNAPLNNEFLVVNQLTIQGPERIRRPDLVIFINGIPVAIFELKNPRIEEATIHTAYQQLQDYKKDIPDIFKYNQILVISDLSEARYGTISASYEWFKIWRGINDPKEKLKGISQLEVLTKGIFQKTRLLDFIENFIVFEADGEKEISKYTKKIALYHQYFGVNKAIRATLKALKPKGNGRIGVFWHTQGSGKTLSMVFYVNKARKLEELKAPTFVFLTDRNDLDKQFYRTFLRSGYAKIAKQTESIKDLKEKLKTAGAELIFTTIQKFGEDFGKLSDRNNIIVIADEAHRSQYAELAARARKTMPSASFMGITATPIDLRDRNTRLVFGDYIDVYSMSQGVKDKAIVPIYYEGRLVPLHLTNYFIDEDFDKLTQEIEIDIKESLKRKFARLKEAVSVPERMEKIVRDIVNHFNSQGMKGKAMVVTISREIAVKMYKIISNIKNAPETAVVISKPEEFKDQIKETNIREIEKRFRDPKDSLKMVVVCDMWLTGFDVPCLTTMYLDKPLKNHSLMQAIARVNRIYKDKSGGLIVDYIGIADDLRKALGIYDPSVRKEAMIPLKKVIDKMLEKYDVVKSMLAGVDFSKWKYLREEDKARIFEKAINVIITNSKTGVLDEEKKKRFLTESLKLIKLHSFVMPHKEAYKIKNDIEFIRAIRSNLIKYTVNKSSVIVEENLESMIKELISKSIAAEKVIDIFALQRKGKPDISILDEKFLEEVRKSEYKNLSIGILRKLLSDRIKLKMKKNRIRYKSFLELLDKIIEDYENRVLSASKIIERLIELAKEIKKSEETAGEMGLTEEELAFYDAVVSKKLIEQDEKIKKIVKELVKSIRRDISIDWTNNDIIKARIRDHIRLILLKNQFHPKKVEEITSIVYQQAIYLYKDYKMQIAYA